MLRATPGWDDAINALRVVWESDGEHARTRAAEIRSNFAGRRGLMVLDVVLSRQRRYTARVTPRLNRWLEHVAEQRGVPTLRWVEGNPDSYVDLGLRDGEADTIGNVTAGLLRYADDHRLDEDQACVAWAHEVGGLEVAPDLDPYIGAVKGIGPALFAYLRILCGADTIKPDVRVLKQLRRVGVQVAPASAAAGFLAASAVAHELGIPVIELDQLLWYATERNTAR